MHLKNIIFAFLIMVVVPGIIQVSSLYGRGQTLCAHQRGDSRCNDNEDCCSGRKCNSFGYCELRRD